jgi:ubiquinone/menaquinone biosynthesis C-methylase UbiE
MLRELAHFARHAPGALRLKARLPQHALYQTLMERMDAAGLGEQRAALVADLRGDILELGSGTGIMFAHYAPGVHVTAVEPDAEFAAASRERASAAAARVEVREASGEHLPFADASFDSAVVALVLCSVGDADAVLREVHRVLRADAPLRLLEHVRSPRRVAGWLMDRIDPLWLRLNGQGCHLNRDPLPALERNGFRVEHAEPFQVFSAGIPAFPMRRIEALRD